MKKIEAIIRPYLLEQVKSALSHLKINGMIITPVEGFGQQKGHTLTYRGTNLQVDFLPKMKIEIIVRDQDCKECVAVIMEHARTGKVGDGKIFVSTIDHVIRIRTGELDEEAMS